jgi:wobble nucleotide-excising tRNase
MDARKRTPFQVLDEAGIDRGHQSHDHAGMTELKKIIAVKNVGKLTDYSASGDVTLRRMNLVYGQNAHGKTSLTAILRSVATGDAGPLKERETLGGGPVEVDLLSNVGTHTFRNGAWSAPLPDILVFDTTFISENVYTGDIVDASHRRNLYAILIGAANVAAARRINDIDTESRQVSADISKVEASIRERMHGPYRLERFVALVTDPSARYDQEIANAEAQLGDANRPQAIARRPRLVALPKPDAPGGLDALLAKTVVELNAEVAARVATHLQRLGPQGETWVSEGLPYAGGGDCPFCGQSLEDSPLVKAYATYFSQARQQHASELEHMSVGVAQALGDELAVRIEAAIASNSATCNQWSDVLDASAARDHDLDVRGPIVAMREAMLNAIERKRAAPGTAVVLGEDFVRARKAFALLLESIDRSNEAIGSTNARIAAAVTGATVTDTSLLEPRIVELRNLRLRGEPEIVALCEEYDRLRQRKTELTSEKERLRADLEAKTTNLLMTCENDINHFLEVFGASFRIAGTRTTFAGGRASSTYKISINEVQVEVDADPGSPGFRSLSAGDRSTVALAFFLAQLRHTPDLDKKVVVIDDPISSLDAFRCNCTEYEIAGLARQAAQVIVLSHDAAFLHGLYDICDKASTKCLQFRRKRGTSEIVEWDAEKANQTRHRQDHFVLDRFLAGDADAEPVSVARRIRPYLEGSLRVRFPSHFKDREWLGDFIDKVRKAPPGHDLEPMKKDLTDVEKVNTYSKKFHHEGVGALVPEVDPIELETHIRLALRLAGGGPTA